MAPNVVPLKSTFGRLKFARFKALKISARNCIEACSVTFVSLFTDRSIAMQIRTDDHVASRISKRTAAGWANAACSTIRSDAEDRNGVSDKIGPIVQFARATGIHAQKGCDRQTALSGIDPADLPAIGQPFRPQQPWKKAQFVMR